MVENTAQITTNHLSDHDLLPIGSSKSFDADDNPKRTGTVWTASAYIATAVTGPVVLNFAWDMAQLGWIAGPFVVILFSLITYFVSTILCASYRSPATGKRNPTYMNAIRSNFDGSIVLKICWVIQYLSLCIVTSEFTASVSKRMADINWFAKCHSIYDEEPCYVYRKPHYIAFGVFQIFLSQIPNFHQLRWLTVLCLVMFLLYSPIGLFLAIAKVAENGMIKGSLTGMSIGPQVTRAQKTWMIFTAIGDIAQAYDFSSVLLEIQDTVGSPPSEVQTMKKATRRSVAVITIISMVHACMGYAAFGDDSPEFLPDGFYKPYWLINIASVAMVIQAAGGYQIFVQPIFAMVENSMSRKFPNNEFIEGKEIWIPRFGPYKLKLFRLVWRTFFVTTITLLSMFFAVFLDVLKLVRIMAFWPIVIYFPIEMYIVQKGTPKWSARWLGLQILSFGCLIVTIAAVAANVVEDFLEGSYKPIMPNRY
ncbi:amino acid permease 3-like [Juglans microcarpa x Juglans regia]|uniref:amino acid permease 3-like n=1 Tax=Juglans microcarpa x Juglans regia TaxID=2249226 RepID=UPI001B7F1ACE|nr:amino acid permease 3-like [Juglans microcarpa x Juglans regia]